MAVDTSVFIKKLQEKKERVKKQQQYGYANRIIITGARQKGGRLPAFVAYRQPIRRRYDVQDGAGIGKVFGSLFKFLLPLVKKGGRALGKHALHTGMNIVHDVLSGEKLKESAKHRVKETGNKIVNDVKVKIDQMTGKGSRGHKRKGPPAQSIIRKSAKLVNGRDSSRKQCTSEKLCRVKNHHFFQPTQK